MTARRTLTATFVALLMVAAGILAVWLVTGSGIFASASPRIEGPLAPVSETGGGNGSETGLPLAGGFQVAQPRDPFRPLTSEPPATTSTLPGQTTTTIPGQTTTTTGETTTTEGFEPQGTRVVLLEIREEGGVRTAVLTVDGETYTVGVGDTFAESFKVVSLGESSGVFQYGDSAFTLAIGQAILK
jgi:hypothetical protein